MKKCEYCGFSNNNGETNCRKCGVELTKSSPVTPRQFQAAWFPHSNSEWARTLAYPLFACCLCILAFAINEGGGNRLVWRYAGPYIAGVLLPLLGVALAVVSCGPGLSRKFRIVAVVVGLASALGGLLAPALAE